MKLNLFIIIIFIIILQSCKKNNEIETIIVENDKSTSIDIFKGLYTVHYINGNEKTITFPVDKDEIKRIKKVYSEREINNMDKIIKIVDTLPLIMPSSTTIYTIKFINGGEQKIQVEDDSRTNPLTNRKFRNIKPFIDEINKLIDSKQTLKNAPESDIIYL